MLQRLGIRGKILAVVAVPILVLIVAAGVITLGSVQDLNSARNAEELVDTLDRARDLQADLQDERILAANFVHVVQDTEAKIRAAYDTTADALDDIATRLAEPDIENPQEIQAAVDAALSRSGDSILEAERALSTAPATEESGGWMIFPTEDEVTAMQEAYAAVVAELDSITESLLGDTNVNVSLAALAFRVNAESELKTSLFTAPLQYQEPLTAVTSRVDNGVQSLLGSTQTLSDSEENDRAVEALLAGQAAIADLDDMRANVRAVNAGPATVTTYYSGIINTIVDSVDAVAVAMADRGLVASVQAYGDLDALVENIKYEEVVVERLIRAGTFLPGEAGQVRTFMTETDLSLVDAQNSAATAGTAVEVPPFGASAAGTLADTHSFGSVRTQVLTGLDSSLFTARNGDWNTQVSEELGAYEPLREQLWEDVQSQASANSQNALVQTILTAIAVAAVVIISIVVALVIARTIIGPLRRLTTTATAVRQELPRLVARVAIPGETVDVTEVQIPVESRDEVGRLAEAFNGVNAATLDIAGEQAALRGSISEMFVNVARRDQVLLNRQLASIDEMERTEDNPNTLTKLFALDHLATRMRRNSESLLVLAGIDTGRRLRRPMPLSDVIRTASSEIELYERVQLELDVDPQMLGHSALTTAHLIAELLENATVFSDPGTSVVVRTAERGDSYVVEVEDSGIGMTAKELEDANSRINSTSASEILGAQRLGLFVVGRIARRVGAAVTIASQEGKGTVATVSLPKSTFASSEELPAPRTQVGTVDEATHAPVALTRHNVADEVADAPARAPMGVDAYTPTAIEGGASLTGRGGARAPGGERSIEDLIASDAANAPVAEPADPAALTDGSSPAGLPSRRRREGQQTADAGGDQSSIVGLPARATDAQLSALAAEGARGFTPAVPAAEVAPQTAEERSSMFRGFRSRRGAEEQMSAQTENQGVPVDSAGASTLPVRTPSPVAPPTAPVESRERTSTRDAGMAAAGAAGAAAFFTRRARDEDGGVGTPPAQPAPSTASAPQPAVPQFQFEDEGAASAQPDIPEFTAPDSSEAAAPAEPAMPVFRMPKLDGDPGAGSAEQQSPAVEDQSSAAEFDSTERILSPGVEAPPFEIPGFEDDLDDSQPMDQFAGLAGTDAGQTPAVADQQETYEDSQPSFGDQGAPDAYDSSQYEQPQQYEQPSAYDQQQYGEQQYEQPQAYEQPSAYEQPAAPAYTESPAPWAAATPVEPAAAPSAPAPAAEPVTPAVGPRAERSNANLDALLQSAADSDTEQRPGFFSRLFGRGRNTDADSAGAAATQWADVGGQDSAPASAASAPMAFSPVLDGAPQATPRESMFSAQSAPQAAEPPATASAPAPWETGSQAFVPAPESQPSAADTSAPASWQSAPAPAESDATPAHSPAPWEQAPPATTPQRNAFSPDPDQAPAQRSFTPDQLADATGWQAAGASALQAAQPDVAKSYQPVVIQPDESGAGSDADVTSAVFSEFSSLAAERPKVERTRAGLERRRPSDAKPVEVKPIEETPEIVPVKRDADAIRSRFSSFYSGTQRARDDVADFDRRAHENEVSDT